tara:strand:- start:2189 stop:2392 length:204 start_codon:yes stop_codon:yes gene_type:complete
VAGSRIWTELLVGRRFKAGNGVLCSAVSTAGAALAAAAAAAAAALAALAAPTDTIGAMFICSNRHAM